jgi:hypothetical protein
MAGLSRMLDGALAWLPTEQDFRRGHIDSIVRTRDGATHVLRLRPISAEAGKRAIKRWESDRDNTALIRSVMEQSKGVDEILSSIDSEDSTKLFVRAIALAAGPEFGAAIGDHLRRNLSTTGTDN